MLYKDSVNALSYLPKGFPLLFFDVNGAPLLCFVFRPTQPYPSDCKHRIVRVSIAIYFIFFQALLKFKIKLKRTLAMD